MISDLINAIKNKVETVFDNYAGVGGVQEPDELDSAMYQSIPLNTETLMPYTANGYSIYRRVIQVTSFPSNPLEIEVDVEVGLVYKLKVMFKDTGTGMWYTPESMRLNNIYVAVYLDNSSIYISYDTSLDNYHAYVTYEYVYD